MGALLRLDPVRRSNLRVAAFAIGLVLASLVAPRIARADDVDALVKHGVELRRTGRDREALAEFQKAAAIQKTPRIAAQVGLAEQALGLWVKAEADLKGALAAPQDPWIQKNRATLDESLKVVQRHVATVEIWGEPTGAEVLLDEEPLGTLPLPRPARVAEGDVVLRARAQGYAESTRTVKVTGGEYIRQHIELRAVALGAAKEGAGAPPPALTATAATLIALPSATAEAGGPRDTSSPVYRRWWFWTLVGGALAGGAAVVVLTRKSAGGPACDPASCTTWMN
jgi:hypothetical protein